MFKGSITISMTKGDVLVGSALLKKKSGIIPVTIDSSHLGFIRNFKMVIDKLKSGFSYVADDQGNVVNSIQKVKLKDTISITVTDGEIIATVDKTVEKER